MAEKISISSSNRTNASSTNFEIYKETLAPVIYRKWKAALPDPSKNRGQTHEEDISASDDLEGLSEFIDYLARESFPCLPSSLQTAKYTPTNVPSISSIPSHTLSSIPLSFTDSLVSYSIVPDEDDAGKLLLEVMEEYLKEATKPPPVWASTRKEECEICERNVPVTYHHLIPRSVHAKVLKRGWHEEWMLNSVAWLCRPCHSMCHKVADNETLAKDYFTVERLLAREDMQRWARYMSKQRFKVKRG